MAAPTGHQQPVGGAAAALPARGALTRPAAASLALAPSLALFIVAALVAFVADIGVLRVGPAVYTVDAGSYRAVLFLSNVYDRELDQARNAYRWTTASSTLQLASVGIADQALLTLHLGGRPTPGRVELTLNGEPWGTFIADTLPRKYTLPLPIRAAEQLTIGIHSETFNEADSPRQLGVKLVAFDLAIPRDGIATPPLNYYLWQIGLLLVGQLVALLLGWNWRWQALLVGGLGLASAIILGAALLLATSYLARLTIAFAALAALTWIVLPLLERRLNYAGTPGEIRLLWSLGLAACAIRLFGVLYPSFGGQDLDINLQRLVMTSSGQMIIIDDSSEFANGLTIYPPGPYLAVLPGLILTSDQAAMLQGFLATLDGLSAFLIALLARRLGGNRQAARLALVLYAVSYPAFATMTYGFAAQIFGQWFTVPLLLVLLASPDLIGLRTWTVATVLLLFQVFSHIGVAILGMTWIGLLLLLLLARPYRALWQPYALILVCGLFAFGLLYVDIAAIMLSHAADKILQGQSDRTLPGATPLLIKGALLTYTEVGLALLPLGLLLIDRATLHRRIILLAMLLTTLLFLIVDLVLAVQVRYFYFALPLALAAIGIILGRLAARGRWASLVVWALALIVVVQNVALWFQTTIGDGKFSLTPLTH